LILASALTAACVCSRDGVRPDDAAALQQLSQGFQLDQSKARADLTTLTAGPHVFGSPRQTEVATWIEGRLKEAGVTPVREPFKATVPNPAALGAVGPVATTLERGGVNIYGIAAPGGDAPCAVALASHYDTKDVEGTAYLGANDSGSSTTALLQLLAYVKRAGKGAGLRCAIIGAFFDGEEAVLRDWSDGETRHPAHLQDNTYGSRFAAARLTPCKFDGKDARCLPPELGGKPLVAVILMDMIGSPGLAISRDANSSSSLVALAAKAAGALGKPGAYDTRGGGIEDDHMPYRQAGVATLDLIDFNHLDYWHRAGDDPGTLAMDSIELAGRMALYVAGAAAREPGAYLP
jgi:hypothetical protein